ncbi:thioredoxin reductase [Halovenus sp. WSH3]|uniref:Thioredoxin reductase n=1 Tax=Halovenus carboxidivorans TaxID=2692199 RepID=A0A6B0T189_9EURY|nr:NAD(P)/FAD-dependent oxidoreductase [Halovenus carboxidivorans]MXR51695.1 thioredoxin reductase [Halovenus carboxidivorans]
MSTTPAVTIIGAGPAGLTAGIYTARAGLDTTVLQGGQSILNRNAHLENVPGFPAGINARRYLELTRDQARRNDCTIREGTVRAVRPTEDGFLVETEDDRYRSEYVICASWADTSYLDDIDGIGIISRGSKAYIDVEDDGATGVDGLYAAGRIAGEPHQTVVSAGHGAKVALSVIHDSEVPFYHDWVAPEGYFTDRGRDVPPGCEEITDEERARREEETLAVMQEYFADRHPEGPTQHPSVRDE